MLKFYYGYVVSYPGIFIHNWDTIIVTTSFREKKKVKIKTLVLVTGNIQSAVDAL